MMPSIISCVLVQIVLAAQRMQSRALGKRGDRKREGGRGWKGTERVDPRKTRKPELLSRQERQEDRMEHGGVIGAERCNRWITGRSRNHF